MGVLKVYKITVIGYITQVEIYLPSQESPLDTHFINDRCKVSVVERIPILEQASLLRQIVANSNIEEAIKRYGATVTPSLAAKLLEAFLRLNQARVQGRIPSGPSASLPIRQPQDINFDNLRQGTMVEAYVNRIDVRMQGAAILHAPNRTTERRLGMVIGVPGSEENMLISFREPDPDQILGILGDPKFHPKRLILGMWSHQVGREKMGGLDWTTHTFYSYTDFIPIGK